jgi:hypothetical protein
MSEKQEFKASARVRVTVEVMNLGPYVAECKAEYIHDRAASEAKQSLQTLFSTNHRFRIVGEPQVEIVSQRKVKP